MSVVTRVGMERSVDRIPIPLSFCIGVVSVMNRLIRMLRRIGIGISWALKGH